MMNIHSQIPGVSLEENKIFVGGLHAQTTKESLQRYFSQYGEVEDATVMYDPDTKRSRGFGFVSFKDVKSVPVACDRTILHTLDNKKIDPKPAFEKGSEAEVQENIHKTKVFIGGVPQDFTNSMITEHFSKYGTVVDVDLKVDKKTDRMRGFGFVGFSTREEAEKATATPDLRFQNIHGKTIEVKPAEARRKKEVPYGVPQPMVPYNAHAGGYPGYNEYHQYNQQGYPPHPNPGFQQPYPPHPPPPHAAYNYGSNSGGYGGQGGYGGYSSTYGQNGPSYGQGGPSYGQGGGPSYGQSGPNYGQGGSYGGQGGGPSYGQSGPGASYGQAPFGQQDYSYQRNFGNAQQQMTNYPPHPPPAPPQDVGPPQTATGFNQQRSNYSSATDTYPPAGGGHPAYGGYGGSGTGYEGYNYTPGGGEQTVQTNTATGYGRGGGGTGTFGYNR